MSIRNGRFVGVSGIHEGVMGGGEGVGGVGKATEKTKKRSGNHAKEPAYF